MINFEFTRVTTSKAAVEAVTKNSNSQWIAGGTNLIDLMKKGIVTPQKLIDINDLPLSISCDFDLLGCYPFVN